MLTLRTRYGDIIVMAARVVHRPAPIVGSCLQDRNADEAYKGGPRFLGDAALLSGLVMGGDADGLLRFWDAATGAKRWTLPVHKSAVIGVHLEATDIVTRGFTGESRAGGTPKPPVSIPDSRH